MSTEALLRLEHDGFIRRDEDGGPFRTTKRWQAAMARAALRLFRAGERREDLRIPIVAALLELYGPETPSEQLIDYVEAILPIEAAELNPHSYGTQV